MPSPQEDPPGKTAWRRQLRAQRRALPDTLVAHWSREICLRVASLAVFQAAGTLGGYLAIDHEVDAAPLLFPTPPQGMGEKAVYLPVVTGERLDFVHHRPGGPLRPGAYGILEPADPTATVLGGAEIGQLDLLLLPLVGFDGQGTRLGFGGGYYDRLLARRHGNRPVLLGLAYSFQEVPALPRMVHDHPLDYVVTEKAIHAFAGQ